MIRSNSILEILKEIGKFYPSGFKVKEKDNLKQDINLYDVVTDKMIQSDTF